MIIVAGMDNTGKTTLVNTLKEALKCEVIKSPGPISKEEQEKWLMSQFARQLTLKPGEQIVYERFPVIEEMVYGKVLRNDPKFTYGDRFYTLLQRAINPIIIYCRPTRSKIFDFGTREQMEGVIEKSEKLLAEFDELMFRMIADGWKVLTYSYEVNDSESLIQALSIYNNMFEGVL